MNPANTAIVGGRLRPRVIAGCLSPDDRRVVFEWGSLNAAALVACWEGWIDAIEPGQQLQPMPAGPPVPGVP